MKMLKGFNKSAVRINDDNTIDYCLSDSALSELDKNEYAFVTNKFAKTCDLNEPIYVVFRDCWQDEGYASITFNESFDDYDRKETPEATVTNMEGQLFVPDSMLDVLDVDICTKRDAINLARDTIKKVNNRIDKPFDFTDKLINHMIDEALEVATWQTMETVFDDCIQDDMVICQNDYHEWE